MAILYKAARIIPWIEPGRGRELFSPLPFIDNGEILVDNGLICELGKAVRQPSGCKRVDLGDVTLLPPLVNCHVHLQLSWLKGKTLWGKGFTAWLKSMVPLLIADRLNCENHSHDLEVAVAELEKSGTGYIGDIGSGSCGNLLDIDQLATANGLFIYHFRENIGFRLPDCAPWPDECLGAPNQKITGIAAPGGHALYSTSPHILAQAHKWCVENSRKFVFHLAEAPEETEMLLLGKGPLYEFFRDSLLPSDWRCPGLSPYRYAEKLGLLGSETLVIHGVNLAGPEIRDLAASGAALCFCARSNNNLGVGMPPLKSAIKSGVLLCLGTDGLTSCADLDLRKEVLYLRSATDIPLPALWRMATANGLVALGLEGAGASLEAGAKAKFSLWLNKDLVA